MFGILDYIKIGAGVALGLLLSLAYWNGIPIVKDIPYISYIPLVGDLAVGHVQAEIDTAVTAATAKMVSQAELTASKAETFELKRQLDASSQALADNEKQRAADEATAKAKDAQTALDITEYENRIAGLKRQWTLDANDVKFFNSH